MSSSPSPTILISTSRQPPSNSSSLQFISSSGGFNHLPSPSISSPIRNLTYLSPQTFLAVSSSSNNSKDNILLLFTHQKFQWKFHLNERLTAIIPVLHEGCLFGGGQSGRIFVWHTSTGQLLKTIQAHHRCITTLIHSHGRILSGGEDGIVNSWSITSFLSSSSEDSHPQPLGSWSEHHLPVTGIACLLPGERFCSVSLDCQIVVFSLVSDEITTRVLLPCGISCVTSDESTGRVYAGGTNGSIYIWDVSAHAASGSARDIAAAAAAVISPEGSKKRRRQRQVLSELVGHERGVDCVSLASRGVLVSGGKEGVVRVWDVASRSCIKIVTPWQGGKGVYPISGLLVFGGEGEESVLLPPLEKYERQNEDEVFTARKRPKMKIRKSEKKEKLSLSRMLKECGDQQTISSKNTQLLPNKLEEDEVEELKKQLSEAKSTIERWQNVNNKLMIKLKNVSKKS